MYTSDGYMSVLIMKPDRPPFKSGDVLNGTSEEMDHIYHEIPNFFPIEYDNYVSALPEPKKVPTPGFLYKWSL
ncbi:lipocalin-like domain-containing protein [candidate division KSB1 bacterium]|nr:lipocalin-like domain-containing protein [candidate division KSB1 bacterium]